MDTTPYGLLRRFQSQPSDAEAWHQLIELYRPWLLGWLRNEAIPLSDAEDIVQDVLVVLFNQLPNFRHNGNAGAFRTWLRGIVVNRLRVRWREQRQTVAWPNKFDDRMSQLEDSSSTLSRIWEREHDRFVLQKLLNYIAADFETRSWEAFRSFVLEKKSAAAVAQEFGLSEGAVFTIKSRVLKRLRQAAKEIFPDG